KDLFVESAEGGNGRLVKEVAIVLPAPEKLTAGFFKCQGDLELGLAGRQIDRLHREVTYVEGVTALPDEENSDALVVDTGDLFHGETHLEKGRAPRVADHLESIHHAGKWILLILQRAVDPLAVRGEVINHRGILVDDTAERN